MMLYEAEIDGRRLELVWDDITYQAVDAIVNAANSRLGGGGGVDGAIHSAGGPAIMAECDAIRAEQGGCRTGEAVVTTAGKLDAKYIIHTVGPVWTDGERNEPELLSRCYANSLRLAEENGCRTVAFPSISTGVYRFPVDKAAHVALRTVLSELTRRDIDLVRFVLFSKTDLETYAGALEEIVNEA
jgi:O-acetyl-ADP-ribose deacetylase (regulator of RNase III)